AAGCRSARSCWSSSPSARWTTDPASAARPRPYARAMPETFSEQDLRDENTALLRDLLRVDTTTPPGRETAAATLLKDYLEASGVECELVARDPDRPNLVARIRGTGAGPSLELLRLTAVL